MSGEQEEPASPCVGVCRMDGDSSYCRGCRRTLEEIAAWPGLSNAEKRIVLARLAERGPDLEADGRSGHSPGG